jgi:hypothetical protein
VAAPARRGARFVVTLPCEPTDAADAPPDAAWNLVDAFKEPDVV